MGAKEPTKKEFKEEVKSLRAQIDELRKRVRASEKQHQELQVVNRRFESIFERSFDGLFEIDRRGRFTYVSPAVTTIAGYTAGEVMGRPFRKFIHLRDMPSLAKSFLHLLRGNEITGLEYRIKNKDGSIGHVEINAWPLYRANTIGGVQGVIRNITDRKEAERKISQALNTKDVLLNATSDAAFLLYPDDLSVIDGNTIACNMLQKQKEEIVGRPVKKLLSPPAFKLLKKQTEKVLRTRKVQQFEVQEGEKSFEYTLYPVRDKKGPVIQLATYVHDITEEKQLNKQRFEQQKMAAMGRIAAVVAHELNTPLANISMVAENLFEELPKKYWDNLQDIKTEVFNASGTINHLLGFSQTQTLNLQSTNLRKILDQAVAAVRQTYPLDGTTIIQTIDTCPLVGDEYRLFEGFRNIIANAVLSQDGSLDGHTVQISATSTDVQARIIIADNGIGMDNEVKKRACEPFFSTRPKGEGTGLGLFVAQFIIKQHGGTLLLKSAQGNGTQVTVILPRRRDA